MAYSWKLRFTGPTASPMYATVIEYGNATPVVVRTMMTSERTSPDGSTTGWVLDVTGDEAWDSPVAYFDDGGSYLGAQAPPLLAGPVDANVVRWLDVPVLINGAGLPNVSVGAFTNSPVTMVGGFNAATLFNNNAQISDTLLSDLGALVLRLSGITSLANWLRNLARKGNADPAATAEINANNGTGVGTFNPVTDSQEAIRDQGDVAWIAGAGSGSEGGIVFVTPIMASATNPRYSTRNLAPIAQGSSPIDIVSITDGAGTPIMLAGRSLRLVAYLVTDDNGTDSRFDDTLAPAFTYETAAGGLTIGGSNGNEVSIHHDPSKTATAGEYRYFLWDVTDEVDGKGGIVLMKGRYPIEPAVRDLVAA